MSRTFFPRARRERERTLWLPWSRTRSRVSVSPGLWPGPGQAVDSAIPAGLPKSSANVLHAWSEILHSRAFLFQSPLPYPEEIPGVFASEEVKGELTDGWEARTAFTCLRICSKQILQSWTWTPAHKKLDGGRHPGWHVTNLRRGLSQCFCVSSEHTSQSGGWLISP